MTEILSEMKNDFSLPLIYLFKKIVSYDIKSAAYSACKNTYSNCKNTTINAIDFTKNVSFGFAAGLTYGALWYHAIPQL